jgi:hypothetical protein
MSGSNSSAPASGAALDAIASPLGMTVHAMPAPSLADGTGEAARRTGRGRRKMLLVLLICAAPVLASYLTYFVIRPTARTNYSALIEPLVPVPADLPLTDLAARPASAASLRGQWLLLVVSGGACDADCERRLWLQRQLRETLGREKDRVDKVWLIADDAAPRPAVLDAIRTNTEITVLRVPAAALAGWLRPAAGHALADHLYVVDPLGNWMMRAPANAEPSRLKRDVEKLLRASAGWDKPGR